jgi:hypothetical protein
MMKMKMAPTKSESLRIPDMRRLHAPAYAESRDLTEIQICRREDINPRVG